MNFFFSSKKFKEKWCSNILFDQFLTCSKNLYIFEENNINFYIAFRCWKFWEEKKSIIKAKIKENIVKDNTIGTYQIKIQLFEILKFKISICQNLR